MPSIDRLVDLAIIETLRHEIAEAGGSEIFVVLSKSEPAERYDQIEVVSRGTPTEVPALITRAQAGDMTLHNHPSGVLRPSDADMRVASLFGEEGVGSMIIDNQVTQCYVIVEPAVEKQRVEIDSNATAEIFKQNGTLSKKLPGFEAREGQVDMSREVANALNQNQIKIVEAGTGTGKSLAYLIPAMLWAKENKRRVVVATKTIALQEQLVHKDIPLAQKVIPDAPRASLVKGRQNFVCLRKMNDVRTNQLSLFGEEEQGLKGEIERLAQWVDANESGDKADLPFEPSHEAWEALRSDSDMCQGIKCPFYKKSPFYESRRDASASNLMVVNQALLFTDLAVREESGNYKAAAVIPAYEHIILDEAHSIEDIATSHFGSSFGSLGLRWDMLKFMAKGRSTRGLLQRLSGLVQQYATLWMQPLKDNYIDEFRFLSDQAIQQTHDLSQELHLVFNSNDYKSTVAWLKEDTLADPKLAPAKDSAQNLLSTLFKVSGLLERLFEEGQEQNQDFLDRTQGLWIEFQARLNRFKDKLKALKNFAVKPAENQIPWLELRRARQFYEFTYHLSPLDVSGKLNSAVFQPMKSVIMTSATLDIADQFKFFSSRNGLHKLEEPKQPHFYNFPSPFNYAEQGRLFLPHMTSEANSPQFIEDLGELVWRVHLSGYPGGTLVLFTAYAQLYQVARWLEEPLYNYGAPLYVQGRAPRSHLVADMKKAPGVLLGTDSFWEGVDLPGMALTKVIMAKLPFRQVGDPIFEARCKAIENGGKSSFSELSMPLALLKFMQGIGRLIRNKSDRGVLVVADNRIRTKGYGSRFLNLAKGYPVEECTPPELIRRLNSMGEAYR
jgi:ATP-dependent DNA helicase DinG